MGKQDIQDLFVTWKAEPSPEKETQLLRALDPTIESSLRSYGNNDPKLKTRAYILARESLDTYTPDKNTALTTYVHTNMQRLRRYAAERTNAIHIPENVRLDNLAAQRYVTEYQDKNGYEPSALQVADDLKWSQARARKALNTYTETPEAFATTDKGDSQHAPKQRTPEDIWEDYVYHDLDDRNRKLYEWATGYGGAKVLQKQEIAKRLGLSGAAVSQRLKTITKRLERYYEQV
jgi:DNA-directed RNA polymerase specialized sigma subunit